MAVNSKTRGKLVIELMAEWKDLCLHEDVEKLILARLQSSELCALMLAGAQSEVVSRKEAGAGRVGEVVMEFIKNSGFYRHSNAYVPYTRS